VYGELRGQEREKMVKRVMGLLYLFKWEVNSDASLWQGWHHCCDKLLEYSNILKIWSPWFAEGLDIGYESKTEIKNYFKVLAWAKGWIEHLWRLPVEDEDQVITLDPWSHRCLLLNASVEQTAEYMGLEFKRKIQGRDRNFTMFIV
jgi:hypothetical protein